MKTKFYAAPVLRVHGKLEDLTHSQGTGNLTDAAFPIGTPFSSFTFS